MATGAPFVKLLAAMHLAVLRTDCSLKPVPALEVHMRETHRNKSTNKFDIHL
jgi:hypothetical protein